MVPSLDNTSSSFLRGPGDGWAMAHYCPYFRGWAFLLLFLVEALPSSQRKGHGMVRPDIFVSSLQSSFWRLLVSCCPRLNVSGWAHVICSSTEAFWHPSNSNTGEHPWNQIKSVQYSDNPLHLYTQTSVIMLSPLCFQNGILFYLILWL